MNKKKISIFLLVITFIFVISSQTLAVTNLKVTGLSVKVSDTSVVATWNKLDTAIGYEIYVNIQNRGYQYLGAVTSNTVTINGFIKGEDYAIKVKAFTYQNGTKVDGTFSEEVKFTAGKQPQTEESNLNKVTNLSVTVNDVSKVTLNWNAVTNAIGYDVYINIANRGYVNLGSVTGNGAVINGFEKGVQYQVKVAAYNYVDGDKKQGEFSEEVSFKTGEAGVPSITESIENQKPEKVTGVSVTIDGLNAKITWNKVNNASGYEIEYTAPWENTKTITTSSTSYTITGVTNYTNNYTVRVRAYKYVNSQKVYGDYSNTVSFKGQNIENLKPVQVTGVSVSVEGLNAKISWNKVSDASGYEIEYTAPGEKAKTTTTSSTSCTLTGVKNYNGIYTVRVRAYKNISNQKVYGNYSNAVNFRASIEALRPTKVTGLSVKLNGTQASLSWSKTNNADGYEIYINVSGNGYAPLGTVYNNSSTINGFTAGNSYAIKVRAYKTVNGQKLYGEFSSEVKFTVKLDKVTGLSAKVVGPLIGLNWNRVAGADGYEISMQIPGYGTEVVTTNFTSKTFLGISTFNGKYTVKVRAYKTVNGQKVYGEYSNSVQF